MRTAAGMPPAIVVVAMTNSSDEKNGWSAHNATRSRPVDPAGELHCGSRAPAVLCELHHIGAADEVEECSAHSSSISEVE